MRRIIYISLLFLFAAGLSAQGSALSRYLGGNKAYRDGNFDAAIQAYEDAIVAGANDYRVFYNLGNAYFRLGMVGRAVLSYERARYLAPRNKDVLNNLKFVKSTSVGIVREDETNSGLGDIYENTALGLIYGYLGKISFAELSFAVVALSIPGTIFLVLWILIRTRTRRWFFAATIVFWGLLILTLIPYAMKSGHIWETDLAIITSPVAEIRSAPSEKSQLKYTFREGMEIAIYGAREDRTHVVLRNGEDGWVRADLIEAVIPR